MDLVATIESVQAMAAAGATRLVVRPAGEGLPVRLRINVEADKMVAGGRARRDRPDPRLGDAAGADAGARRL